MSKKTNRTLTKLVSSALAMMMLLGGVACDQPSSISEVKYGKLSESEVWGAPATEKVLQDVHGIYDAFTGHPVSFPGDNRGNGASGRDTHLTFPVHLFPFLSENKRARFLSGRRKRKQTPLPICKDYIAIVAYCQYYSLIKS